MQEQDNVKHTTVFTQDDITVDLGNSASITVISKSFDNQATVKPTDGVRI